MLARSYDLKVFESVTQLCPPRLCAATAAAGRRNTGFRALAKETARAWKQIALPHDPQSDLSAEFAEETDAEPQQAAPSGKTGEPEPSFRFGQINVNQPSRFREFLDSFKADEQPSFHFVHLLLPHTMWRYLPSGMQYGYPSRSFGRTKASIWGSQPWPVTVSHQRHLLQLAFTDRLVGQMIERLRQVGLYDKALVVVTADHGGSFTPAQHVRIPAKGTAHEMAWVPLLIKAPQQTKGRVDDRNWEHVDLVPTVADALGIQVPWRIDGVSALGSQTRTTTKKTFYVRPGAAGRVLLDGPSNLAVALGGVTDRLLRPQDGPIGLYKVGVVGEINGATSVPDPAIAVAVNGTIGGVSEVFRDGGAGRRFAAMVPDFLFRQDGNRVELFEVDPFGGTPRLRPIRWRA